MYSKQGVQAWRLRKLHKKKPLQSGMTFVTTTGVEPAHPYGHYPLKVARLPIPPRGQMLFFEKRVQR
jgi:hypothetical protein